MASTAVRTAIGSLVADAWTHTPIVETNEGSKPLADLSEYLQIEYTAAAEERRSIGAPGANYWREEGVVLLLLMIPKGRGIAPWYGRLDDLRAALRGQYLDGVHTGSADPPMRYRDDERRAYHVVAVALDYHLTVEG